MTKKLTIAALIILAGAIVLLGVAPSVGVASAVVIDDGENNGFTMDGYTTLYDTGLNQYGSNELPYFITQFNQQSNKYPYNLYEYIFAVQFVIDSVSSSMTFLSGEYYSFTIDLNGGSSYEAESGVQLSIYKDGYIDDSYPGDILLYTEGFEVNKMSGGGACTFLLRFTNENVMLCASNIGYGFSDYEDIYDYISRASMQIVFDKDTDVYKWIKYVFYRQYTFYFSFKENPYGDETLFYEKFALFGKYNLEVPTKEGHTFNGWYYDQECTRPYDGKPITSDINLYAGWTVNQYKVYFNDYDTGYITDVTADWGTSVDCDEQTWEEVMGELEGGVFSHWAYADGTPYEGQPIKEETHLFAIIEWQYFTITLDTNGGEPMDPLTVKYGEFIYPADPVREGYTFECWCCGNLNYYGSIGPITSDLTLVAIWLPENVTVTFYVDDEIYSQIRVKRGEALYNIVNVEQIECIEFENSEIEENSLYKIRLTDNTSIWLLSEEAIGPGNSNIGANNTIAGTVNQISQKAVAFMEKYKLYFIIGGAGLGALIVVIIVLCAVAKKKRRRR